LFTEEDTFGLWTAHNSHIWFLPTLNRITDKWQVAETTKSKSTSSKITSTSRMQFLALLGKMDKEQNQHLNICCSIRPPTYLPSA